MSLRILLATTVHLDKTARLAIALTCLGCEVVVLCPPGHWVRFTACRRRAFAASRPLGSLHRAIRDTAPDIIIPCDDRAVRFMHRLALHSGTTDEVRERLLRSLAPADRFAVVESRPGLLALAREIGVTTPDTQAVTCRDDLDVWGATHAFPWVLKLDGSWAGMGVRIVRSPADTNPAFKEMDRPVTARLAIGQAILEWDFFWFAPWAGRGRPAMSVQQYVPGHAANCAVACWQGELLDGVAVETVASASPTEPATLVRVVDGEAMLRTAAELVRALRLTGLIGFDFQIHAVTGEPYLIEMNPRAVPLCHLPLGEGRDIAASLVARLTGAPYRPRPAATEQDLIAYFPDAAQVTPADPLLSAAYHDIPWDNLALTRALLRSQPGWQRWIRRAARATRFRGRGITTTNARTALVGSADQSPAAPG